MSVHIEIDDETTRMEGNSVELAVKLTEALATVMVQAGKRKPGVTNRMIAERFVPVLEEALDLVEEKIGRKPQVLGAGALEKLLRAYAESKKGREVSE